MAGKGFTDKGNRIQPTSPFDWDTGAKLSAGEGAGTSDTTEATQLLVKAAVEAIQAATESPDPALVALGQSDYEPVAASATNQAAGATGAAGDYLSHVTVFPGTTSPGAVTIKDGSTTIATFPGGANSVSSLVPFPIPLGIKSVSGAWNITTGTNVTAVAVGDFT